MLDRWGIIYDQPLLLSTRQAGAAIEGAIRQSITRLERVAVDTHGYTDVAMAIAKLLGFDLCPRLYSLRDRKLHVPRGFAVSTAIADLVVRDVSLEPIREVWDDLLRLIATIEQGWRTATDVLEHFGSAARGDRIYRAGHALGQLLRTVYLCDYFTLPEFRRLMTNIRKGLVSAALDPSDEPYAQPCPPILWITGLSSVDTLARVDIGRKSRAQLKCQWEALLDSGCWTTALDIAAVAQFLPSLRYSAAAFCSFPPLQVLIYRLPDVILHRRLRVVRKLLQCGDLSRQQIRRVSPCDLLTRTFLGGHGDMLLLASGGFL